MLHQKIVPQQNCHIFAQKIEEEKSVCGHGTSVICAPNSQKLPKPKLHQKHMHLTDIRKWVDEHKVDQICNYLVIQIGGHCVG